MIAIDTNLLVYAHWPSMHEHKQAIEVIEHAANAQGGCGIPFPCIAEFWSVVTHSTTAIRPSTVQEAKGFLNGLLRAGAVILDPKAGVGERLAALADDLNVTGGPIFDLQIALISFEASAREIWTHDRRFPRIAGLPVRHPF